MVRLLIADANTLIRTGIRTILTETLGVGKVAEVGSGAQALARLRTERWDLCVLDVSLPERGGLEILRHIRKRRYDTKVLFLSSYADRQYAAPAVRLGASGYVLKECSRDELHDCAQTALNSLHTPVMQIHPICGFHNGNCRSSASWPGEPPSR
jgi:two-component system invasion response regulator UvrY